MKHHGTCHIPDEARANISKLMQTPVNIIRAYNFKGWAKRYQRTEW